MQTCIAATAKFTLLASSEIPNQVQVLQRSHETGARQFGLSQVFFWGIFGAWRIHLKSPIWILYDFVEVMGNRNEVKRKNVLIQTKIDGITLT